MSRLNLLELVQVQREERYRAVIIHGPAMSGKTATARALARAVPDATYVDLLELCVQQPSVAERVDRFRLTDLEQQLLALEAKGQVVIVDHLDPILNIWTGRQRRAFAQWVDDGLDGFTDTDRVLIFFIQTDPAITEWPMRRRNRLGRTRAFRLDEFNAL